MSHIILCFDVGHDILLTWGMTSTFSIVESLLNAPSEKAALRCTDSLVNILLEKGSFPAVSRPSRSTFPSCEEYHFLHNYLSIHELINMMSKIVLTLHKREGESTDK